MIRKATDFLEDEYLDGYEWRLYPAEDDPQEVTAQAVPYKDVIGAIINGNLRNLKQWTCSHRMIEHRCHQNHLPQEKHVLPDYFGNFHHSKNAALSALEQLGWE